MVAPHRIHRFEIKELLGSGGMGSVYRAADPQLDHDVAIKVASSGAGRAETNLTLDLVGDAPSRAVDLLREAAMMAQIHHPNVVGLLEVGRVGDLAFVVMEYVAGSNLAVWLRTPRRTEDIRAVFAQAGRGLAAAHAAGIVHRDFKPENVLVGHDGRTRVAGFGLSCSVSPRRPSQPRVGDHRGTPRYLAPELALGEAATAASDVYAFSMALSDALAGRVVSPALRAMIVSGVSAIACARPPLRALLVALEVQRWTCARWLAGGVAVLAIGVVGGVGLSALHEEPQACATNAPLLAGRWDPVRRSELTRALGNGADADRILRALDDHRRAIDEGVAAARASPSRLPCLERRAIELGVVVDAAIAARPPAEQLEDELDELPNAEDCAELAMEPLPDDRERLVALYRTLAAAPRLAPEARGAKLAELAHAAADLDDHELAVRATMALGWYDLETNRLGEAKAGFGRAYVGAVMIHARLLAGVALMEQDLVELMQGDPRPSGELAERATELPATLIARLHAARAHAAAAKGDRAAVVAEVARAREAIARSGRPLTAIEQGLRFDLIPVLAPGEAVELARDTIDLVRASRGEHDLAFATASTLLADALVRAGNPAAALPLRRRAIAVELELAGPEDPAATRARLAFARELAAARQSTAARDEYQRAIDQIEHAPGLHALLPEALAGLAAIGRHSEAAPLLDRAIDEATALGDPRALDYRTALANLDLDLGKLAGAERQIAALERAYAADRMHLALVRGLQRARLLIARRRAREAEPEIRAAIAAWDELHGDDRERADLLRSLATCMLAEHRWNDAHVAFARARMLDDPSGDRIAANEPAPAPPPRRPGKHPR